ncbi:NAD-dependent epimerase/dehydratase family protein [Hydrogenophaga sp. NFH-34]|uniref:NAD-dependent epimerase/dehydratase family protein n=1 Tax=Hydrogenophaga sp. NFH-34 TaxID=2744446 RepID=UPI001F35002A|nr:NAD-dependent epimerase/dehydratase family protein [Hydrogenophaga sp. NFH-34]
MGIIFQGALPARFRRERVLIVGCGDVGLRAARELGAGRRARLLALTSSPERHDALRSAGIVPLAGNLDAPASLRRLAGLASRVLHLAPPPAGETGNWWLDGRTRALTRVLALRGRPLSLVYGSTSGVYGDRAGAWVRETDALQAQSPRALRRVDAEAAVRWLGRAFGVRCTTLRIPGIYAHDRAGGPRDRLLRGTPVLRVEDDVFTSHIHADDLARACVRALWQGRAQRCLNVADDTELRMGDYFDVAADLFGLPRPPRLARDAAREQLPVSLLSFMNESRRLRNDRLKAELRLRLRYPTVAEGLCAQAAGRTQVPPPGTRVASSQAR